MAEQERVALEVAEAEFERFIDAMDLMVRTKRLKGDARTAYEDNKETFIGAIQRNTLVVDPDGAPVFTPVSDNKGPIKFAEPDGETLIATDSAGEGNNITKLYRVVARMTGQPEERLRKLKQRDSVVLTAIVGLFLA